MSRRSKSILVLVAIISLIGLAMHFFPSAIPSIEYTNGDIVINDNSIENEINETDQYESREMVIIKEESIGNNEIANKSITAEKIADYTLTFNKISNSGCEEDNVLMYKESTGWYCASLPEPVEEVADIAPTPTIEIDTDNLPYVKTSEISSLPFLSSSTNLNYLNADQSTTYSSGSLLLSSGTILDVRGELRLGASSNLNNVIGLSASSGAPSGSLFWGDREILDSTNVSNFGVSSVSNVDGSLVINPTTGAVVASLDLTNANTWTGTQTFTDTFNIRNSTTLDTAAFGFDQDGLLSIVPTNGVYLFNNPGQAERSILSGERTMNSSNYVYGYNIDVRQEGSGGVYGLLAFVEAGASTGNVSGSYTSSDIDGAYTVSSLYGSRAIIQGDPGATVTNSLTAYDALIYSNIGEVQGSTKFFHANEVSLSIDTPALYGLYVDELTEGDTNYAIYTEGSTDSYFGGDVEVGGDLSTAGTFSPATIGATQTLTSYDNTYIVDRNGGGDFTTINQAISAINTAGDNSSSNPYTITVMNGTYDEDIVLPDFTSISGQSWESTTIDGRVTIGSGNHVQNLWIYPTGGETIAVVADPDTWISLMTNTYVVTNPGVDAPTYLIEYTGDTDFRIMSSFLYARNSNAGASAAAYIVHSNGASGDIEIKQAHAKISAPLNSNAYLALNDSSTSGSDIIFSGSWSVFNDANPVAAVNNNSNGEIKLDIEFENDQGNYNPYSTSGDNIIVEMNRTDKLWIAPGSQLTSGNLLDISYETANTLSASLNAIDIDLSTNVTDGDNEIRGLNMVLPDSGTANSYGLYIDGEEYNYMSGALGIGVTTPETPLHIASGTAGILLDDTDGAQNELGKMILRTKESNPDGFLIEGRADGDGSWNQLFTVERAGNVGIGTTDPDTKLEVSGNYKNIYSGTGWAGWIENSAIGTATSGLVVTAGNGADDMILNLRNQAGASQMQVLGNGYVGIGSAPATALDVSTGRARISDNTTPTTGEGLELGYDGTHGVISAYDRDSSTFKNMYYSGSIHMFSISGSYRAYVDSSGLVAERDLGGSPSAFEGQMLIRTPSGATNTTTRLAFADYGDVTGIIESGEDGGALTGYLSLKTRNSSMIEAVRITKDGHIGFGTSSPTAPFELASGRMQITDDTSPTAGQGLELGYDSSNGILVAYDRDGSTYKGMIYNGSQHSLRVAGTDIGIIRGSGYNFELYGNNRTLAINSSSLNPAGRSQIGFCEGCSSGTNLSMALSYDGAGSGDNNKLHITGAGSDLVTFTRNGYVGINDTSPETYLDVTGTSFPVALFKRDTGSTVNSPGASVGFGATTTGNMVDGFGSGFAMRIQDSSNVWSTIGAIFAIRDGADNSGSIDFRTYQSGAGTTKMWLDNSGKLGIGGTTSPRQMLDIDNSSSWAGIVIDSGNGQNSFIDFYEDGSFQSNMWWDGSSNYFGINSSATADTVINPNGGYVGIGIENPSTDLDVDGNVRINGMLTLASTSSALAFSPPSDTTRHILKYGTAGNIGDDNIINLTNRSANGGLLFTTDNGTAGGTGETERFRITGGSSTAYSYFSNTNVGIGDASPSALLTVGSGDLFTVNSSGAITAVTGIASSGVISTTSLGVAGATDICINASNELSTCSSSMRYKQDFMPLEIGLAEVLQLEPVTFNWKADGMSDLGLVAEEVKEIAPELTFDNADGEVEGVKYRQLTAVLINAIKELQAQIDELKANQGVTVATNPQQSGSVTILANTTEVTVIFEEAYTTIPTVSVTPTTPIESVHYIINKTETGFTIVLSSPQLTDVEFDWIATE